MRGTLRASLGVAFFAFTPALLAGATGADRGAFRISQALLAAYQLLLMTLFFRSAGIAGFARVE